MRVDRRTFARTLLQTIPAVGLAGLSRGRTAASMEVTGPVRARVWSEGAGAESVYPDGVDAALVEFLDQVPKLKTTRARLGDPQAGLSDEALDQTDVLLWWGRLRHDEVPDDRVEAVVQRVRAGKLGFLALYASCGGKPFRQLMNSMPCEPGSWREDGKPEYVSVQAPEHPIAAGVGSFTIPKTDMFSEPFAVPEPETVVLVSRWERGETVRSGLAWTVDKGRVAYLRAGPESFPVLYHPSVRQIIANAVMWTAGRS